MTKQELMSSKYGHRLDVLSTEARRRRLGIEVQLLRTEIEGISVLNRCYSAKELEYVEEGFRTLPSYALVHEVAGKLCHDLQPYVRRIGA